MSEDERTKQLHKAYQATNPEQTTEVYNDWAKTYEAHMSEAGYTHPAMVASMFSRHVKSGDQPVLDAGAGTGIMGEILTGLGFSNLTGIDASEQMLARAASDGKYQQLKQCYLGEPLEFDDNQFAVVVSSGVFTQGHAPLSGFDELIRITEPGGILVFSVSRSYLEGPFQQKRNELESGGLWRFIDASERYNSAPLADTLISQVFVFEVV
ncbi:MAG: putative TPR repeat methyltransferase [Polaribacter sp.]|jgi:predicted TPR repeat methyltransferase